MVLCLTSFLLLLQSAEAQNTPEGSRWSVKRLMEYHLQQHAQMHVQDVVKLFYQAAFGVEHILADTAEVTSYLRNELASVDTGAAVEPLLEPISLEGTVVRVNLRPFKVLNLDPLLLVKVMFTSARETKPDTLMFYRMWNEFSALVKYGILKFPSAHVDELETGTEGIRVKPLHHSDEYQQANKPAYRVVRRNVFEEVFQQTKP